ncbi:MAG: 3-phosphoshikimate 1-carboxyvinyltransferase [Firmicutes bacterium HGW-Firmicutes-11]|nr:MAG: 3-phosphoshikimate 1-carboxyvinyltransferase [Firmicutes bacterium HGW-Firmicutes-11]
MSSRLEIQRWPAGTVTLPPSKSISHRAMICAALSEGTSRLSAIDLRGDDVAATAACLSTLGTSFKILDGILEIRGGTSMLRSRLPYSEPVPLDCGESGSTLRFLIPLLLQLDRPAVIAGHGKLMTRPMAPYLKALEEKGATFHTEGNTLSVQGRLVSGEYHLPGNISSQYLSGLLLSLPLAEGDSEIQLTTPLESGAYVDMTISVMREFGVIVEEYSGGRYRIPGNQVYQATDYTVEADYSAAAFFLAAGALGCNTGCLGLRKDSMQGDRAMTSIIAACGGEVFWSEELGLQAKADTIRPITVDIREFPDLAPPIAALLCFADGESRITGAARLRMKESDRLHALATQLSEIGADIREEEDQLVIHGVKELHGGVVDPQNDHRIAMAAAVASIKSKGAVTILDPDCVKKSYPDFWKDFCRQRREETR